MAKSSIDLHGYSVDAVADAVDGFLVQLASSGLKRAKIVTGKGTGKVQKEVIRYLKLAGYPWEYDGKNKGVLVLFLD